MLGDILGRRAGLTCIELLVIRFLLSLPVAFDFVGNMPFGEVRPADIRGLLKKPIPILPGALCGVILSL